MIREGNDPSNVGLCSSRKRRDRRKGGQHSAPLIHHRNERSTHIEPCAILLDLSSSLLPPNLDRQPPLLRRRRPTLLVLLPSSPVPQSPPALPLHHRRHRSGRRKNDRGRLESSFLKESFLDASKEVEVVGIDEERSFRVEVKMEVGFGEGEGVGDHDVGEGEDGSFGLVDKIAKESQELETRRDETKEERDSRNRRTHGP